MSIDQNYERQCMMYINGCDEICSEYETIVENVILNDEELEQLLLKLNN